MINRSRRSSASGDGAGTREGQFVGARSIGDVWIILLILVLLSITGCREQASGYLPARAIARNGFLTDQPLGAEALRREIRLWGFVDHGNLHGDGGAKRVLGEWWSGDGPDADTWRFDPKAEAGDPVGRSFAVLVPNDAGREYRLERFVADARARRATKVLVTGRLAPTQTRGLTGLYLQLRSSRNIRFDPPDGD